MTYERTRHELRSIWMRVLDAPDVTDSDDFFDLGGDSLAAAQMTSMAVQVDVPLRAGDILRNPRFADLVGTVHRKGLDATR